MSLIYLDNAATTPLADAVRQAMEPYFGAFYGNPSSVHRAGREARAAVERAREQTARAIGADPSEILFTSGGTEADNTAIIGTALAHREQGRHIVTTSIEHHAVLHTCQFLQTLGFDVTYVAPQADGRIRVQDVVDALRDDTILVSVMMVNNETGAIQPIAEIGRVTRERGIKFHTDAVQAAGLLELDVAQLGVDLLSLSGHKLHGPKGVGALYVHKKARITPFQHGGSQERDRRAGTENLPGIVGFGTAIAAAVAQREQKLAHIAELRDVMMTTLARELDNLHVNSPVDGLPAILNVTFAGVAGEALLMNLDMQGIAASAGSACTAGSIQPSHVLLAMGLAPEQVKSAIRFSFSGHNTREEVEAAAQKTVAIVQRLRR